MSRALITDDSPSSGVILAEFFQKLGQEMDTAAKEQKRLDKITVNQPDCLLLDNMMSVTDGLQTLEILRDRNFIVPINPTADIQECLKTRSLEVCATKVLNKPIKHAQLREASKEILSTPETTEVPCR